MAAVGATGATRVLRAVQHAFGVPPPRAWAPPGREPPWRPWLPAVGAGVAPESEALLGVALALHRAPTAASRPAFSDAVAAWLVVPERWGKRAGTLSDLPERSRPSPGPPSAAAGSAGG